MSALRICGSKSYQGYIASTPAIGSPVSFWVISFAASGFFFIHSMLFLCVSIKVSTAFGYSLRNFSVVAITMVASTSPSPFFSILAPEARVL